MVLIALSGFVKRSAGATLAAAAVVGACGVGPVAIAGVPAVVHEPVKLTGTDGLYGPDFGAGITFNFITLTPTINNSGLVAVQGITTVGGPVNGTNNTGLYLGTPGNMSLVARTSWDADGFVISGIGASMLAEDGTIGIAGSAGGPTSAVLKYTGNDLDPVDLIVRGGMAAPGGGTFGLIVENPRYSDQMAIRTQVAGLSGIWTGGPGTLALVARFTDPAPGFGGGIYNNALELPRVNTAGQVIYSNTVSGGDATPGVNDTGLWFGAAGSATLLARRNVTDAPGTAEKFGNVVGRNYSINDQGTVAFATVTSSGRRGVWIGGPGNLAKVALEGEQAAGLPAGVTYSSFNQVLINGAGKVAFVAQLVNVANPNNDSAIFYGDENGLEMVVQEGDTIDGIEFNFNVAGAGDMSLNGNGDIVFTARRVGVTNDALFGYLGGTLVLIALEGQQFDVDPGPGSDLRTIIAVRGPSDVSNGVMPVESGGEDGGFRFLNDAGQFIHRMDFTDGSHGVFVSSLVSPCPWDCAGTPDGVVGTSDLLAMLAQWGTPGACDFDGGGVGTSDLLKLLANWSSCPP